eukprot:SAG11_NODE_505_length_8888_cov_12.479235_4_plen_236_part_00
MQARRMLGHSPGTLVPWRVHMRAHAAAASTAVRGYAKATGSSAARRKAGSTAYPKMAGPPRSLGSWASLRKRLMKVDACALCDGSGKQARVVDTVRPLVRGRKMVGRAHTVELVPGDFLMNLVALEAAKAGDVLMIDAGFRGHEPPEWPIRCARTCAQPSLDHRCTCELQIQMICSVHRSGGMFGELLAAEAERKGLAGMVIDGNCVRSANACCASDSAVCPTAVCLFQCSATRP